MIDRLAGNPANSHDPRSCPGDLNAINIQPRQGPHVDDCRGDIGRFCNRLDQCLPRHKFGEEPTDRRAGYGLAADCHVVDLPVRDLS